MHLFLGKLKSKWKRSFLITNVFPHGAVEQEKKEGTRFRVIRERIKVYLGHAESVNEVVDAYYIDEVELIKEVCRGMTLSRGLLKRQPKVYTSQR